MGISSEEKQRLHELGQKEELDRQQESLLEGVSPVGLAREVLRGPPVRPFESEENWQERKEAYDAGVENVRSNASEKSSGCFLSTACLEAAGRSDDCDELRVLREFRDSYALLSNEGRESVRQYYQIAPGIVAAIKDSPDAKEVWEEIYQEIQVAVVLIRESRNSEAFEKYKALIHTLSSRFSPLDRS